MTENTRTDLRERRNRRKRMLVSGAVTVVVLAAVILGVSALSSPKDSGAPKNPGQTSQNGGTGESAAEESRRLLELALKAKRSGDASKAVDLAEQALDKDPDNTGAQDLIDELTNDDDSTEPTSTTVPVVPNVSDPAKLLPAKIAGYAIDPPISDGKDAVVSADPLQGSADFRPVNTVLFSAHDRGSEAKAKAFVDDVHARVYGTNRTEVVVAGGAGYFGTDGSRLACVAFYRGKYAFEVVVTAGNATPLALRDTALRLASAFRISQ